MEHDRYWCSRFVGWKRVLRRATSSLGLRFRTLWVAVRAATFDEAERWRSRRYRCRRCESRWDWATSVEQRQWWAMQRSPHRARRCSTNRAAEVASTYLDATSLQTSTALGWRVSSHAVRVSRATCRTLWSTTLKAYRRSEEEEEETLSTKDRANANCCRNTRTNSSTLLGNTPSHRISNRSQRTTFSLAKRPTMIELMKLYCLFWFLISIFD